MRTREELEKLGETDPIHDEDGSIRGYQKRRLSVIEELLLDIRDLLTRKDT